MWNNYSSKTKDGAEDSDFKLVETRILRNDKEMLDIMGPTERVY